MGYIYIIKNTVNDKVYIGQTVQTLSNRMAAHRYRAKYNAVDKLHKAMQIIGISQFYMELIEECDNSELNIKEMYYVNKYDSYKNGYNSTPGGGASASTIDDLYGESIVKLYLNGKSSLYIAKLYECSDITILNILNAHGIQRRDRKISVTIVENGMQFDTIADAARHLINVGIAEINLWSLCNIISKSCTTGKEVLGYHFIKTSEINSKHIIYCNNNKCNKVADTIIRCKVCKREITAQSSTGMCNSCANVAAKGKSPKPSKEELKALLDQNLQKKQIAKMYGRTDSTVHYWIKHYEL